MKWKKKWKLSQIDFIKKVNWQNEQKFCQFFVQNHYLTNKTKSVIIGGRRALARSRFPLYHSPQVLSSEKLHKFSTLADPGIVQIYQRTCVKQQSAQTLACIFVQYFIRFLLQSCGGCGIIISRREHKRLFSKSVVATRVVWGAEPTK